MTLLPTSPLLIHTNKNPRNGGSGDVCYVFFLGKMNGASTLQAHTIPPTRKNTNASVDLMGHIDPRNFYGAAMVVTMVAMGCIKDRSLRVQATKKVRKRRDSL